MAMLTFGGFGIAKAQSITIDAPNTVYTNSLVSISLNTSCSVSSVNWDLQGGTIVNSHNNGASIDVQFATTGSKYIQATTIVSCSPNYQQQLLTTSTNINVVQAPNPPVAISGKVANSCGYGLSDVRLNGLPNNPITDSEGNFSVQVSSPFSGTISPSKPQHTFSSQTLSSVSSSQNLTFNLVSNYHSSTPRATSQSSFFNLHVDGLIIGESYSFTEYSSAGVPLNPPEIFIATNTFVNYSTSLANTSGACVLKACGDMQGGCR